MFDNKSVFPPKMPPSLIPRTLLPIRMKMLLMCMMVLHNRPPQHQVHHTFMTTLGHSHTGDRAPPPPPIAELCFLVTSNLSSCHYCSLVSHQIFLQPEQQSKGLLIQTFSCSLFALDEMGCFIESVADMENFETSHTYVAPNEWSGKAYQGQSSPSCRNIPFRVSRYDVSKRVCPFQAISFQYVFEPCT